MALVLNDRVKETTTTTGTGTVNLAGAETGFETFVAGIGNSNTCYYAIVHQSADEFEVGLGTVTDASPDTLARTTVISSSNSDSAVNFSAGTKDVFCTLPASKAVFLNSSADINLADNSKILLGAGDDLQIYHDGSNSIIVDNGTGGLFLRGTNTVDIQSALGHNYLKSTINAGTQIYHNNSEKFATVSGGIKVTGDIENNSGDMTIDVAGDIILDADGENIKLHDDGTEIGQIDLGSSNLTLRSSVQDKNTIFRGNDGGTEIEAMRIDYAEGGRVGIGTNSPAQLLEVNGNGAKTRMTRTGSAGTLLEFFSGATAAGGIAVNGSTLGISGGTGENHVRIDSSGNVGINESSPDSLLHVNSGSTNVAAKFESTDSIAAIQFTDSGGSAEIGCSGTSNTFYPNGALKMSLDSSGNLVASGNITAYGSPSDIKLKENIEVIDNALDKVKQLKGITYDLKSDGNRLTGLIAQDLEKVLPEAVYTAKDLEEQEHLAIRYGNTVGLLVEAIKELEARVKELEGK